MDNVSNCTSYVTKDKHWVCKIGYLDTDPAYCSCISTYDCTPDDIKSDPRYQFQISYDDEFLRESKQDKRRPSYNCQAALNIIDPMPTGAWICTNKRDYSSKTKRSFYCDCKVKVLCTIEEDFIFARPIQLK